MEGTIGSKADSMLTELQVTLRFYKGTCDDKIQVDEFVGACTRFR